jgi:urease accessory protein UreE
MKTAKQHNALQTGESELLPTFDKVAFFHDMMHKLGCRFVDVTPPPNFTAKVMRRIKKGQVRKRK